MNCLLLFCCKKVLFYDLRSSQPLLVKDHFYNLPIKSLNFHNQLDLVVSADSKIIKMWNKETVSLDQHGTCVAHFIVTYLNFSCLLTAICETVTDCLVLMLLSNVCFASAKTRLLMPFVFCASCLFTTGQSVLLHTAPDRHQ